MTMVGIEEGVGLDGVRLANRIFGSMLYTSPCGLIHFYFIVACVDVIWIYAYRIWVCGSVRDGGKNSGNGDCRLLQIANECSCFVYVIRGQIRKMDRLQFRIIILHDVRIC